MSTKAYEQFSTQVTPQSEPIPGEQQVANNAGGYVYSLDKWSAFERFLILGSEGGTYYVAERPLTVANAQNTMACIAKDGRRAVDMIVAVSDAGRAPKNTPAEFALALAAAAKDEATRAYALSQLPKVCRIPTHLFHFLAFVTNQRGWSRMLRRAVSDWYARWDADALAYELVKYQQRDGWSNRDALRLSHVKGRNIAALRWAVGAQTGVRGVVRSKDGSRVSQYAATDNFPAIIAAFEEAKTADTKRLVTLIRDYGLTREMVPSEALASRDVWEALLEKMPMTAMLRNLGNMSKAGLLTPMSAASRTICDRLSNADAYKRSRIHPVGVLVAMKTYAQGRGEKGSNTWSPIPAVVDALDAGFYLAFGSIVPTGKRILYALDVSGSMTYAQISGLPITPAVGATAMAMACARTETSYHIMGFDTGLRDLGVTPRMRLDQALKVASNINGGGTDCALPMVWAEKNKVEVDAFVVITDNETWAGRIHPSQALRSYRRASGINAKQVVMGMTATNFTISDPLDPGALDVVGFDAATPQAVNEFVK